MRHTVIRAQPGLVHPCAELAWIKCWDACLQRSLVVLPDSASSCDYK